MKPEKILILGAGYTGKELAKLARRAEFDVVATTRDDETAQFLRRHNAEALDWSVGDDPHCWTSHLGPTTAVVYSIPTLFRSYEGESQSPSEGLPRHVKPVARALALCDEHGAACFSYLSSTSVYGDHGGDWVDENTSCKPSSPLGKMRYDIEAYLMTAEADVLISVARLVGIYGPGRTLVDAIEAGRYTLLDDVKKVTNRIHVHDIARALLAIIDHSPKKRRLFNLTDGHPQRARDLIEFICDETGLDRPEEESIGEYARRVDDPNRVARRKNTIRVLNDRLRSELDFELVYPDVFAGYQAILRGESK